MAQPATNPKIEELRFKVKTDPKSRLFYPLAEELRKVGQFAEAEQVLRTGLVNHGAYLSAWVSLGRVLRDLKKDADAVPALTRALEIDRGNVVVARLLADTYLSLGEKVEAIKKYKLVHALMPGDEEVDAIIQRLDAELKGGSPVPVPVLVPAPVPAPAPEPSREEDSVFDVTYTRFRQQQKAEEAMGDAEPMRAAHSESPFEEPAAHAGYSSDAFEVEQPPGLSLARTPETAELPAPVTSEEADVFAPADSEVAPGFIQGAFEANVPPPPPAAEDFTKTLTMADLYANQGLIDDARSIYEDILARDPSNGVVRAKLEALAAPPPPPAAARMPNPKIQRLEEWLSRVKRV